MNTNELLARAEAQDMNRQRQVQASIQVSNRLLEARESETKDAELILELCNERRMLVERNLRLQQALTDIQRIVTESVAEGNNSSYVDRISDVLTDELMEGFNG